MNLQQVGQAKSSNGYGRRKIEREGATKQENRIPSGKSNASRLIGTGAVTGTKGGSYGSPSRDRLVFLTTCMIGQLVEVQVKNGSIYSGIFHAANADKDFGVILKMARLTKDGSFRGQKSSALSVSKAPSKTLIIPAKELVQVIAKGLAVTRDDLPSEAHREVHQELMVDSVISQSRHVDIERELQPWVPDEDDPQCPELENVFDGPWNRGWDQFETNKALFGVKSTFNEDLYTTKLERGPQTRELEKQALRIAREIEDEDTQDLHLAEERGIHLHENLDEESRFSSVNRGKVVDDSGYDEDGEILSSSHSTETFGGTFGSIDMGSSELTGGKSSDRALTSSNFSSMVGLQDLPLSSQSSTGVDLGCFGSSDHAKQLASELPLRSYSSDVESRVQENSVSDLYGVNGNTREENQIQTEDVQLSKSEELQSLSVKKDGSDKGRLSPNASSYAPSSHDSLKTHEKTGSPGDLVEGAVPGTTNGETKSVNSRGRLESSTSSGSDNMGGLATSSAPGLSPSSSVGSLSSEKSTLNPNAKEFKLNPNAKSFIPSQPPVRPPSPVSDGSFYFPTNVTTVPHMPGIPMGIGIGPSFAGPQPVIYNPHVAQMPSQAYFHPNGPQYGQLLGHPRQVLYMPGYIPETPYKGREY